MRPITNSREYEFSLQHLMVKYAARTNHFVYRLSYAGKYIVVKGKTISGSLSVIKTGSEWYNPNKQQTNTLYAHFYKHVHDNSGGRFRVKILLSTKDQYSLLKREQIELLKSRYDPLCLNNTIEAYIPKWDNKNHRYGSWMDTSAILNFKKWIKSNRYQTIVKRYKKKPQPNSATNGS